MFHLAVTMMAVDIIMRRINMKRFKKLFSITSLLALSIVGLASCDVESLNKEAKINLDVDINNKIDLKTLYLNYK